MSVQLPSEPITRKEQYLAKAAGQAVEIPTEPITREEAYLEAIANAGGGTTNYNNLTNKPQIGGVELSGNKSLSDLGIASAQSVSEIKDGTTIDSFADVENALSDKTDNDDFTNLDNEVNGDATTYPYADVITIEDAVPANVADCSVKIEPIQDLHGYDKPWAGGAGKNLYGGTVGTIFDLPKTIPANTQIAISFTRTASDQGNDVTLNLYKSGESTRYDYYTISGKSRVVTVTEDTARVLVYGTDINITNIQIEIGSSATSFAPYTNICPISGRTESSVVAYGKNLLISSVTTQYNDTWTTWGAQIIGNADGTLTLQAGTYTLSLSESASSLSISNASGTVIANASNTNILTFTLPTKQPIKIAYGKTGGTNTFNAQLEYGSTATAYVSPVTPSQATIAFGQTVYGGSVDFKTGVVSVDRVITTVNDLSWYVNTAGGNIAFRSTSLSTVMKTTGQTRQATVISSQYKADITAAFGTCFVYGNPNSAELYIMENRFGTDADAFKTAMADTQICYPLATPITIQLNPQQIQLLKGTNTLTASTGDIAVTVNGVSGSIGQVQEQVNELAEQLPTAPTTDGVYVLTVTVADGTPTYSWESAT